MLSMATRWFIDNPSGEELWKTVLETRQQDQHIRSLITTLVVVSNNGMADIVHHA